MIRQRKGWDVHDEADCCSGAVRVDRVLALRVHLADGRPEAWGERKSGSDVVVAEKRGYRLKRLRRLRTPKPATKEDDYPQKAWDPAIRRRSKTHTP